MKKKVKSYRRTILVLFAAALACVFITFMGRLGLSSDDLSDGELDRPDLAVIKINRSNTTHRKTPYP